MIILSGTVTDHLTSIGSYCYIGKYCYLTKVKIGNYCSIANNVSIGQGSHSLKNISTSSFFYKNSYAELTEKDCVIGNDVWIGVDSIIMRGVTIGNGAVVGSPVKIIKYRFDLNKQKINSGSYWWDCDLEKAKRIIKELN